MNPISNTETDNSIDRLDQVICIYLFIPTLLFTLWFVPAVAVPMALLALAASWFTLQGRNLKLPSLPIGLMVSILIFALAWTALAGVGHFFFANSDWSVRDAVLHDLSTSAWPASYIDAAGDRWIVRAPVAYFLPAAVVGKLLGFHAANVALFLWTAIGWALFLLAACRLFVSKKERVLCVLVLTFFGGMDLVGYIANNKTIPDIGKHIEWWASNIQYSSNTTLLFWVPNHALPAWIATVVILRYWRRRQLATMTPMLAVAIPLWSPLAAIGLFPFFLFGLAWRRDFRILFSPKHFLPLIPIALAIVLYIGMDASSVPHRWLAEYFPSTGSFIFTYTLFCLIEFGLLALILARIAPFDMPMRVAIATLCVLPFYVYGVGNDLAMRASIPALLVIALAATRALALPSQRQARIPLVFILLVGALGAAQEPLRALMAGPWKPSELNLQQAASTPNHPNSFATHYFARADSHRMDWLMRKPVPVNQKELERSR